MGTGWGVGLSYFKCRPKTLLGNVTEDFESFNSCVGALHDESRKGWVMFRISLSELSDNFHIVWCVGIDDILE